MEGDSRTHIILVHGACHGAWCWFKVATRLRSAGHRVTTPDLAASGIDPRPLREVPTFRDYTQPLLDILASLPPGEKVVLVGHSLGGISIALASELFPEKVAAAVFLAAFMPDHTLPPSHVIEKLRSATDTMDTEVKPQDPEGKLPASLLFGPQFTRQKVYQLCSSELQLPYSEDRYGSVRKVYIVGKDDLAIIEAYQRWMIENNPVQEVKELNGADHMSMLSRPDELAQCLADIAEKYV